MKAVLSFLHRESYTIRRRPNKCWPAI